MEDYVGKICPICKQELTASDKVKVCPDCGMPHHEECWEMNAGCSTFGCAQQGIVEKAKPMQKCSKCGTELAEGQDFCPKCGTPKGGVKKNVCGKCGNELAEGQDFCPKCGQRAGLAVDSNVSAAINSYNGSVNKQNQKKKKTPIIISLVVGIFILAAVAFKVVAPKIFIDMEGYLEQGNYEKAYEKAKTDDERLEVKMENIVAVQSAFSAENLKDPSSFTLRDAYYIEGKDNDGKPFARLVLYISGANSYGASVSSYWLYIWDNDDKEWGYFTSVSDLSEEEYSKYDDDDDRLEKLIDNLGRRSIKSTMQDGKKLSKDAVKRINAMFENDTLDDVDLLDMEINY